MGRDREWVVNMPLSWDEALAPYRAESGAEDLLLVLDDPERLRLLVAWPHVAIRRPTRPAGKGWAALWRDVQPDMEAWARCAGVPLSITPVAFLALRDARLIYPDGTINEKARGGIKRIAAHRLHALKRE